MKKLPFSFYIVLLSSILLGVLSFFISQGNNFTTQELAKNAEEALQTKELEAEELLKKLALNIDSSKKQNIFVVNQELLEELKKTEDISIYAYKNDSLCFWSDNEPTIDFYNYTNEYNIQLIKIRNGWYEYIKKTDYNNSEYTLIALINIKNEYDFENRYLNNQFSTWLNLPEHTKLVAPVSYLNHAVKSKNGPLLFEIYRTDGLYKSKKIIGYCFILQLISFILFLWSIYILVKSTVQHKLYSLLIITALAFVIRTSMIYFKIPEIFYHSTLYDAKIFANASSFYFAYLGDTLINSLILFFISVLFYKNYTHEFQKNWQKSIWLIIQSVVTIIFSLGLTQLISSLINNSTVSYNINELFNITPYSFVGIVSVGLLCYAYYLFISKTILVLQSNTKYILVYYAIFLSYAIYEFCIATSPTSDLKHLLFLLLTPLPFVFYKLKMSFNIINVGLIILIFTLITSTLFNRYEKINKTQTYEVISQSLTDKQDVVAENEFIKVSNAIKTDMKLKNLLTLLPLSADQIEQSLRQVNFSGYFERYEIIMSLFKNDCTPIFTNINPEYLNEDYFKLQIEKSGSQTICDDLYFINRDRKNIRYIAHVKIDDVTSDSSKTFHLFLQLEPKQAVNLGAFPDLLLDKSLENKFENKHISYAVYESGKLLSTFGEYQYPLLIKESSFKSNDNGSFQHFRYDVSSNSTVIITDKGFGFWGRFTFNSYLFALFSIIVLITIWFNALVIKRHLQFKSLNTRIQVILVSVVIISLAVVATGTVWVVTSQFEFKNKKDLVLKAQSVLKELQQNIGQQEMLDAQMKDNTAFRLKRLSQLFGSDISLFSSNGVLYTSSQPAIYDQGLLSRFMNPIAFMNFEQGIKANFTQKENIGSLNYLSSYIPFYNSQDKLLGYINLPYFSRQKDLEKELTAYLTTLINIYTILFVITTLTALLISNLLTKPLRIIQEQISNIQFGKYNEALKWKTKDEIGNLVEEYNKMLVKLEKSSELLAASERETAWREMAKQVAHEIKNPLTPMKLNIQHLQRIAEHHPEEMNEKVLKVSKILIEQIDTLSHIATEFSNFAKLPNANLEPVNLKEIIENITELFKQNSSCEITIECHTDLWIKADKEQCIRIFTNLLKNAEQSIPETKKGLIHLLAHKKNDLIEISIKDNGIGIPDELKHKLFTPNFTTKSTGTGLGLAMVKNSVMSFGGTITFESEVGKGTVFTMQFNEISI